MKKHVILMLCCLFALGTGKAIANNNIETNSVSEITYAIDINEVSELDMETLEMAVNEGPPCTSKVTIILGNVVCVVIIEGSCGEVLKAVAKLQEL